MSLGVKGLNTAQLGNNFHNLFCVFHQDNLNFLYRVTRRKTEDELKQTYSLQIHPNVSQGMFLLTVNEKQSRTTLTQVKPITITQH